MKKKLLLLKLLGVAFIFLPFCFPMLKAQEVKRNYDFTKLPQPGVSAPIPVLQRTNGAALHKKSVISPAGASTIFNSTIYAVTTSNETGNGSLRRAITDANLNPGLDIIQFSIPGTGVHSIQPLSPLPEITDALVIDGTTQAGYSGIPLIEIDGFSAGYSDGLVLSADGCTIKGIAVNGFGGVGIGLIGNNNSIEGCYIGISPDGITSKANQGDGIVVFSASNAIGNPQGNRNVISGNNGSGIRISGGEATANKIRNNYIGTNAEGTMSVRNTFPGIHIYQSSLDTIGGKGLFDRNVISGNGNAGIRIEGGLSQYIIVNGNRIGTDASGTIAIGNLHGIEIIGSESVGGGPSHILIGGSSADDKNLVSGNISVGVAFFTDKSFGAGNKVTANLIGTDAAGTKKIPNDYGIIIQRDNGADISETLPGIQIGGSAPGLGNVISGNTQTGITLNQKGKQSNLVQGNYIGTTRTVFPFIISALGNGTAGIQIMPTSSGNLIGGVNTLSGNVIGGNINDGIAIYGDSNFVANNYIGTDETLAADLGNTWSGVYIQTSGNTIGIKGSENKIAFNKEHGIFVFDGNQNRLYRNSIYKNKVLGIDLFPYYISPNDSADLDDSRSNQGLNYPVLNYAQVNPDHMMLHGRFDSKPNTPYTIYIYKNNQRNASFFGEGETLIDSINFTTDAGGAFIIKNRINQVIAENQFISALAVDSAGNTSEFTRALCLQDTDGDGICDCWETEGDGIDANADGKIDLYPWGHGARSYHKDIFVEIDYMKDRRPADTIFAMVTKAFASVDEALISNPDGKKGVKLHLEYDTLDVIPLALWSSDPWPEFAATKKKYFGTALERQSDSINILLAKSFIYRYCIFANAYGNDGSSGMARIVNNTGDPGNDFFVSLGAFSAGKKNNPKVQAGTFMHELGHTLGLGHGGTDDINYKPNYYSVMNYTWQFPGAEDTQDKLSWNLDYSPTQLPTLMESSLVESQGFGLSANHYPVVRIPYSRPNGKFAQATLKPYTPVDWDGDRDSSGMAKIPLDINLLNTNEPNSPDELLTGSADWPNLKFNFRNETGVLNKSAHRTVQFIEMNEAAYDQLLALPPYGAEIPKPKPSTFLWLGTLGGDASEATGISDDGNVVVGWADSISDTRAFRWTPETGMQSLGTLPGGSYSEAYAISADGKTIVGYSDDINGQRHAFRWNAETGMQDLGVGDNSYATSVSADGHAITVNMNNRAYVWTAANGLTVLGNLGYDSSWAAAISADGNAVAGYSYIAPDVPHACLWSSGIQDFGAYYSFGRGISGNGLNVTGSETGTANLHRAFSWSGFEGMTFNLVGNFSQGSDISYNGEYIVGDSGDGAYRLSETNGYEILNEICAPLIAQGSDLWSATAVSSNGTYISGYGYNAASNKGYESEAFVISMGSPWKPDFTTSAGPAITPVKVTLAVKNYPNPFKTTTTISYDLPVAMHVTIIVYNFQGQPVATLVDGRLTAGKHQAKFNGSTLPGGIYICRIKAGSQVESRKMLLVK